MNALRRFPKHIRLILAFSCLVAAGGSVMAQQLVTELDLKYQYPFAAGFEYSSASPIIPFGTDYGADFQSIDLSGYFRWPLRSFPVIQPQVQAGVRTVQSIDRVDPERWETYDHTHFYVLPGIAYAKRLSKTFGIGADLGVGITQAIFPDIDQETEQSRSALYFRTTLGAKATIGLSFNFVLEVRPALTYQRSFSPLTRFNGFTFGMGFSGAYRGGEDPDAPQTEIRAIRFSSIDLPPVFAAMQNYYVNQPVGSVEITNAESYPIHDVEVAFYQARLMDRETVATTIPELLPGESRRVDLFATFNREVFTTEGSQTLTGEVQVNYLARNRSIDQSAPVTYVLHDKTALTWDDDRKVGAFITPQDSALQNYATTIRQYCNDFVNKGLSENVQVAMQLYAGLRRLGVLYEKDPATPFDLVQADELIVDNISLPRETLGAAGDCDDLTVLFNALLETVGIKTGYITIPGHIYPVFDTGVPSSEYSSVHPEGMMTLSLDGTIWVPLEITMINTDDFLGAWRTGANEWIAYDNAPQQRLLTKTEDAQRVFQPVALTESDLGLQYGSRSGIADDFRASAEKLADVIIASYQEQAEASGRKQGYNRLGIVAAQLGAYDAAEAAFNESLRLDRNYLPPKVNLANTYYLMGEYAESLRILHGVEDALLADRSPNPRTYGSILLSISKAYYELENYSRAAEYSTRLANVDADLASQYGYLGSISSDAGSRGAEVSGQQRVPFIVEDESE